MIVSLLAGFVLPRSFNPSCDCTYGRYNLVCLYEFAILDVAGFYFLFIYLAQVTSMSWIIHKRKIINGLLGLLGLLGLVGLLGLLGLLGLSRGFI